MVEIRIRDIVLNIVPQAIVVSRLADDTWVVAHGLS